jgi:hypothetical protein
MACSTKFLKSVVLPDGDKLATRQEAGAFITKTPQDIARWQNRLGTLQAPRRNAGLPPVDKEVAQRTKLADRKGYWQLRLAK